jgi:hypothetical protein
MVFTYFQIGKIVEDGQKGKERADYSTEKKLCEFFDDEFWQGVFCRQPSKGLHVTITTRCSFVKI